MWHKRALYFRTWFEANDENPILSWLHDIPTYHRGLKKMDDGDYHGFVTVYDPEYYGEEGRNRKVFHDESGDVGFAILPHWQKDEETGLYTPDPDGKIEIAGVYNHGGQRTRGWGTHAIRHGFRQGGNYLEAFEGDDQFSLPVYYHKHLGAMPVGYFPWNDEYRPPRWNEKRWGKPGLVQLRIPQMAFQDPDMWLQEPHKEKSYKEFAERLAELKRQAGVKLENKNPINQHGKNRDHKLTPDEYDRLVQGVDDIYFGGAAPQPTVPTFESKKSAEELRRLREVNNPNNEPTGDFTGRCAQCGSRDLWDDNLTYGCDCCGAVYIRN